MLDAAKRAIPADMENFSEMDDFAMGGVSEMTSLQHSSDDGGAFVQRHFEDHDLMLRSYLRRRLPAGEDERDYVQDVYLRVLAMQREDRDRVRNWGGFLMRAAANLLIDRSRRRRARHDESHIGLEEALMIADDHAFDSERVALARERVGQVDYLLSTLDHAARRALIAARVHGMSYADIALELNVTPKDVGRLIERALYALARDIAKQDDNA